MHALYKKKNTVTPAASVLDASVIFVQDVLENVYANTYFSDIMILEAEYCDYFYIYCMFKPKKKHFHAQSYCQEQCGCNNPSKKKCVSFIQGLSTYQAVTTLHLSYKKPIC
jgi:hypothetical protein